MNTHFISFSAPATLAAVTVTAIVYTTITTTGDIAAATTEAGIELSGNILGYGAELLAGTIAGNTVRCMAKSYSALIKPVITNASRFSALGISFLAGSGAALTTSALYYTSEKVSSYMYSYYKHRIQIPSPITHNIILIQDNNEDILLIEDIPTIHSQKV